VLDIGCGSGFYTGFWQARGVRDYVGLDISSRTIDRLANAYPEYRFVHADITEVLPETLSDRGSFDVITVFDVLYHIIDKRRFESAIANFGELLTDDGRLFIMEFLCRRNYQVSKHVIHRARDAYFAEFRKNDLALADSQLLFHFLVPPLAGVRFVDWFFGGVFKVFGRGLRLNDRLATWAAAKLRRLDERMRERNVSIPNSELLVIARDAAVRD
jgi:SAM-dependent methyltransferase